MKRRALVVVGVLTVTLTCHPARASTPLGDTAVLQESSPVAAVQNVPWTGGGADTAAEQAPAPQETRDMSQAAVDAATHQREKAAAVTAPSPERPAAVAVPGLQAAASSMPTRFDGLDRPGAANNGFMSNPSDTTTGKSPNRVLAGANSAVRLSTTSGGVIQTLDLNTFFGAPATNGRMFDPKVYFDRNAANPRYFVVALQVTGREDTVTANDVSRIWVAVSRSPDPADLSAGDWCRYNIDGRRDAGTARVSWADYPVIGAGRDSFSFAMNQFRFTDGAFTFAVVHVWNKDVASNNADSCPTVPESVFQPAGTAGDFSRFTIQPAQHYTSPSSFPATTNPAYYLSTRRGSSTEYHVYRIRNVTGGSPTLAEMVLTGAGYGIPPSSPQPSSRMLVDTGDNRMLHVAGIGNSLVGIFSTVCNFTPGTPNESCTRTPRVAVGQTSGGGLIASIAENTFAGFGDDVFVHHPSIATNSALQSGATWEFGGSRSNLSSASMIKNINGGWTPVLSYAAGTCALPATPPSTTTARSGNYSGAQTDPTDVRSFWLAGEQAVTISGSCQWRTRMGRLVP